MQEQSQLSQMAGSADPGVRVEQHDSTLVVTIDRPKANAIDAATSHALYAAFAELNSRDDLRVGVITGAGERFFSAGWDLKAAAEGEEHDADHGAGGFAGLTEFPGLRKPVIAAVNGSAFGGGVELMLASHLVVASSTARFAFPETRLGILPDAGGLNRLPAMIPRPVALELLLTGREFSAAEALGWGLVNRVVNQTDVMSAALELAGAVCQAAPLAVEATLRAVEEVQGLSDRQAFARLRDEMPLVTEIGHTEDASEGARAFAERRCPQWSGR
jgi:crotonobetainyl-CoA hydratase